MKILILFLCFFLVTGCTIDITKTDFKKNDKEEKNEEFIEVEKEEEGMESIGVSSSVDAPLSVGDYGIASKYNAYLEDYKEVDVSVKTIYENPDEIVDEYNLNNLDKLIEKSEGYKFIVFDYEVIFYDFETESFGNDVRLDVDVVNVDGSSFVVNDVKQVLKVDILSEDTGVVNGGVGTVKVVVTVPDTIENYLIMLGTLDHTIAYYKV